MTDLVSRAKAHLADYKIRTLHVNENGLWANNAQSYAHILPQKLKFRNILAGLMPIFEQNRDLCDWKLHRDFHHLTSSQALTFNLFLPLIADWPGLRTRYSQLFGFQSLAITRVNLEEILDPHEGTNFDVVLRLSDGSRAYVEVKFTESGFGTAPPNAKRLAKLATSYRASLHGRIEDDCLQEKHFFEHYQLYRNLAALRRDYEDFLILLLPRSNTHIWTYAKEWSERPQLRNLRERIRLVALEDVLNALSEITSASDAFARYTSELRLKYCLDMHGAA